MKIGVSGRVLVRICSATIAILSILRVPTLLTLCLLVSCGPLYGQQSLQAQKASGRKAEIPSTEKQIHAANRPTPPPRFLGWTKAQRDGAEMVDTFAKLRLLKPLRPRISLGSSPSPMPKGGANMSPLPAAPSPTAIPGVSIRPTLPAGAIPTAVVAGDFNGDGKVDWVVANGGDNSLYLYLGNGDGTAQLPTILRLSGTSPVGLATADLNGDGKLDLVVAEADTPAVGVLLGNGNGTFQPESEIRLPVTSLCVAIADVNKDGKPDLVVGVASNNSSVPGPFAVFLGNGAGGFGAPTYAPNGNGLIDQNGYTVSVADVNGDGIPDVLSTGPDSAGGSAQIYIGKGDGSFTPSQTIEYGAGFGGFFVDSGLLADMNGDGCPDGVVGDNATVVHIYPGDCKGNFDTNVNYQIYGMGDAVFGLAVADINGDGLPDLVTGGFPYDPGAGAGIMAGNLLGVRLNNGKGQLGPLSVYAGEPGMYSLVIADLSGNGRPEVVTANQDTNTVTVYQNDGTGGFGPPRGGYTGYFDGTGVGTANPAESEFLLGDVDGDGRQDIVQIQYPSGGAQAPPYVVAAVLLNQGNGNFAPAVRSPMFSSLALPVDFVIANFRNTGRGDFLAEISDISGAAPIQEIAFAPSIGGGQFGAMTLTQGPTLGSGTMASGLGVGDFNKDGKLDFVIVTQSGGQGNVFGVEMFFGNGDGTFRVSTQALNGPTVNPNALVSPIFPAPVFVEDANGDGKLDLLVWFPEAGEVVEFLGNGDGTFQAPRLILQNVQELAVADLNHDSRLDLVQLDGGPGAFNQPTVLDVYLGQPDGSFSVATTYAPFAGDQAELFTTQYKDSGTGLFGQVIGDFNGDGIPDIAVFQQGGPQSRKPYLQFLAGNGDGTFTPSYDIFALGEKDIPALTVPNLLGDGREVFLHEDDFSATYHVVEASPGPSFQVDMDERPVLGTTDALRISLNTVSTSDTIFQLSTSDPGIQISGTGTVLAGQLATDVPFTVTPSFNVAKIFSITAQSGTQSGVAYNFVSSPAVPSGFSASLAGNSGTNSVMVAQGSTSGAVVSVSSQGEATATFRIVGCPGLPATATCNFSLGSFFVAPGVTSVDSFQISTTTGTAIGSYPFQVQITDGVQTLSLPGTLNVGDFTLSLLPATQTVSTNGVANYTYAIGAVGNYNLPVTLNCTNLPGGASCLQGSGFPGTSGSLQVSLNQVAPGTYTITLSGTSDMTTHTASAQMQVVAVPAVSLSQSQANLQGALTGASSSASITLQNSGSAPLNIQSVVANTNAGSAGTFTQNNNCGTSLAAGASCQLNVMFAATSVGGASGSLQLSDNASGSPQTIPLTASGVDFSLVAAPGGSTSATISPGQTATYNLEVQPNQFLGGVLLSCSGAPSEAICSSQPSQVGIANASAATFQVQVTSTAPSSAPPFSFRGGIERRLVWWRTLLVLALLIVFVSRNRRKAQLFAAVAILGAMAIIGACGGGATGTGPSPSNLGTTPGTYTLTITGQGGGGSRTVTLTLTVQ